MGSIALKGPTRTSGRGIIDKLAGMIAAGLILMAVAFTDVGTAVLTNRMIAGGTAPTRIGWGVGTTAAAVTQTALVTESAPTTTTRPTGTESRVTTTNTNDTYQVAGTVTAGSTLAITESGLFDANTGGTMFMRSNFTAMNVVSSDSITFTFQLKIASVAV